MPKSKQVSFCARKKYTFTAKRNILSKLTLNTSDAFAYFVKEIYPNISGVKDIKVTIHRYRKNKNIPSERKMIQILTQYSDFKPSEFERIPTKWHVE